MNNIEKVICEMSPKAIPLLVKKKCTCGNEDSLKSSDHKGGCPAKSALTFFAEGQSKRKAESNIEKVCTCDGGCSLDPADHKKKCPAYKKLQDGDYSGDDIDAAEYKFGKDR